MFHKKFNFVENVCQIADFAHFFKNIFIFEN